jgi:hypothetical protein
MKIRIEDTFINTEQITHVEYKKSPHPADADYPRFPQTVTIHFTGGHKLTYSGPLADAVWELLSHDAQIPDLKLQ